MAIDKDLLGTDEHVVMHMRTHAKALIGPVLVLLLTAVLVGLAFAFLPVDWRPWSMIVVGVLALVVLIALVLVPFLKWRSTTYTFTDRRIITRRGLINQTGHDLPLKRVNDVSYERSLTDRMLGCGTLRIQTASERGVPVVLPDVPKVEQVHRVMADLIYGPDEA